MTGLVEESSEGRVLWLWILPEEGLLWVVGFPCLPSQAGGPGEDLSTSGKEAREEGPTQCTPGNGEVPPPPDAALKGTNSFWLQFFTVGRAEARLKGSHGSGLGFHAKDNRMGRTYFF